MITFSDLPSRWQRGKQAIHTVINLVMKNILLVLLLLPFLAFSQTEKGVTPLSTPSTVNRLPSTVWAVVVGISDYQDKDIPDLRFADKAGQSLPPGNALSCLTKSGLVSSSSCEMAG